MEQLPVGWTITDVQLDVLANAPRAKQSDFIRAVMNVKAACTISRLLKTNICMSAKLENPENHLTHKVRRPANSFKVSKTKKQSIGKSVSGHGELWGTIGIKRGRLKMKLLIKQPNQSFASVLLAFSLFGFALAASRELGKRASPCEPCKTERGPTER